MTALSSITGFAQTKSSWARQIESIEMLPPLYREHVHMLPEILEGQSAYMVFVPSFAGFFQKTDDKVMVAFPQQFYLFERTRQQIQSICFSYRDIQSVETGSLLLKSWITIRGLNGQGVHATATVLFNAVRESLFAPMLQNMRPPVSTAGEDALSAEQSKFTPLMQANFKLANLARLSLRRGERVEQILLQEELREEIYSFLGFTLTRLVSPAHISYLTDSEFVVQKDDDRPGHGHYGSVWRFIRRNTIQGVSVSRRDDDLCQCALRLSQEEDLPLLFAADRHNELLSLQKRLSADRVAAERA
jgi:hypothetical protein